MRRLLPALALGLLAPGTAAAQALLRGTIVDDSTKRPLIGVELVIVGTSKRTETDAAGNFALEGLPDGVGYTIVRKIGYRPIRIRTLVIATDTLNLDIRMVATVLELEPLEVQATYVPPRLTAYAERRLAGFGTFLDPDLLRQSEHRQLVDLLRNVRGVRVRVVGGVNRYVAYSTRSNCPMSVWLDGVRLYRPGDPGGPPDINEVPVSDLEAVEIYRGEAEMPLALGGAAAQCGAIVLWTRRGGR
ncbi:MAG: carboxypeptidase-like regulatory domain-containing protein [Gemmatimonadales bacterium]